MTSPSLHSPETSASFPESFPKKDISPFSAHTARIAEKISSILNQNLVLSRKEDIGGDFVFRAQKNTGEIIGDFSQAILCKNGSLLAPEGDFWTLISPTGDEKTTIDLGIGAKITSFQNNIVLFHREGKNGILLQNGDILADAMYDKVLPDTDRILVKKDGFWGALDYRGDTLAECRYLSESDVPRKAA